MPSLSVSGTDTLAARVAITATPGTLGLPYTADVERSSTRPYGNQGVTRASFGATGMPACSTRESLEEVWEKVCEEGQTPYESHPRVRIRVDLRIASCSFVLVLVIVLVIERSLPSCPSIIPNFAVGVAFM